MQKGNVVEEFMLGNTKVQICDDAYRNRSKEDMERTIRNIEAIGRRILLRKAMERELEEREV